MVSTAALIAVVVSSYAAIGGAFYALVAVLGQRIDRLEGRLDAGFDRVDGRFERVESELAGLNAGVAVLESRLEH